MPSLAKVGEEPLCLGSAQALVQPEIQVLMPQRISLREEALCSRHVLVNAAAHLLVLVLGRNETFPIQNSWHHALQQSEAALSWICLLPRSSFSLGPVPTEVLWLLSTIKAPLHY